MSWEDYRRTHVNYSISLSQAHMLASGTREYLKDFLDGLSDGLEDLMSDLDRMLKRVIKKSLVVRRALEVEDYNSILVDFTPKSRIFDTAFSLALALTELNRDDIPTSFKEMLEAFPKQTEKLKAIMKTGFERQINSQALIMFFAHLDAFMADTLRSVCMACPEVLAREKRIKWVTVLKLDTKEDIIRHLTERYVFEFGWQSLRDRVRFLREQLGLTIEYPGSSLELLETAEQDRHVLVHNAGRVSQQYIDKTGREDLAIGDLVFVTAEYLDEVAAAARKLAWNLFVPVSMKFFGMEEERLNHMYVKPI